jgi:hypothetical protein
MTNTTTNTRPLESSQIRRTMRSLVADCVDSDTGEVNRTQLAENTAHELGHDEWLDDSDHILWDFAVDIAEAHERRAR